MPQRIWTLVCLLGPLLGLFHALKSRSYANASTWPVSTAQLAEQYHSWFAPSGSAGHDQRPLNVPGRHDGDEDEPTLVRRIVAVGDLHGDKGNAQKVLEMAGVVDENGDWTGNVDFFVQTGDIIDRGDDTIKLYFWMDRLRDQASKVGGTVLSLLGNHEWMNVIGDWRYVYPSEIKTFGSVEARARMITTGRIGKSWAKNYTTTSRLPLHPSLGPPNTDYDPELDSPFSHAALSFVHGGLAPTYPNLTPYPSAINDIAASLLEKLRTQEFPPPHPPNPYPGLPSAATEEEHRMYGSDGPVWYRGWALDDDEELCSRADDVMDKVGVRRMIMGHTPDFERIVSRCEGKIIIIDTGISHAYGGALSALSITYSLTESGQERELIEAIYESGREILLDQYQVINI